MKKNGKKRIITAVVVIAVVVILGVVTLPTLMAGGNTAVYVTTTPLARMTLTDSISTKGIVESVNKRNVSSSLGYNVQTLYVEVGDRVEAGQALCQLDTEDLELNIAQQTADLDVSQQNSLNQLENNQRLYNEAVANLNSGTNTSVLNAESSLKTAKLNLENAQKSYDDALKDAEGNMNSNVINAESTLLSAQIDLENKTKDLDSNRSLFEAGVVTQDTVSQMETAYTNALNRYNDAVKGLDNAKLSEQRSLEQAESNLKTAKTNYDNALSTLNAAKKAANQDLERTKNSLASAEISANMDSKLIAIQKLEKQLADSTLTAPISGTVTAVYAKEGQPASGLMFVIEDTENLQVKTMIKEYDAGRVGTGMPVVIRADATGNASFDGTITKINPAAEKNAQGETNTASDVEFGAYVSVDASDTLLKVGMNTRLTIILQSKDNVYCVPYDAVTTNRNGETVIYVINQSDIATAIPVTTGMETDFYIEITGDTLTDGMTVINDAANIMDGTAISTTARMDARP